MQKPEIIYSTLYGEYRVTDSLRNTYYTDDKWDAKDTLAKMMQDDSLEVKVKRATVEQEDDW